MAEAIKAKTWNELIAPYRVEFARETNEEFVKSVTVEPLEKGFGVTLGNAMRRVLLSSLKGSAITSVKINGVSLEFSTINGVYEDVADIILNLKGVRLRLAEDGPRVFHLSVQGPCVVTAGMIQCEDSLHISNPEHLICRINEDVSFEMSLTVQNGRGYVSAEHFASPTIGDIPLDAWFSPVKKVSFVTESVRVGQSTDYDSLIITVQTDGTVTPEKALSEASVILREKLEVFSVGADIQDKPEGAALESQGKAPVFPSVFDKQITELDLGVRCLNCLRSEGIVYVGDLVRKKESDLMKTPNFGKKSLGDIMNVLASMGLSLGMNCEGWQAADHRNDKK
ncbi:MAG: DNA-directed RNA polymerase subunit alpha [Alphaproteobacteria bacterium 40-19]|nr:MAG: DNA-directed RNA polymerase subunit alpha [Alphaproteobacteria bacterium 40-19]